MATRTTKKCTGKIARWNITGVIYLPFLVVLAATNLAVRPSAQKSTATPSAQASPVTVPQRPDKPLYKGEQGSQRSEIEFAPGTRTVTVKLQVEDPNGHFLPNIRRENFAVYEDGVRQKIVNVDVEHSPISAALLLELGSRYSEINKLLGNEVPRVAREFLNVITRDDRIAVFKYDDKFHVLADFGQSREILAGVFDRLDTPGFSEANFYDALMETINRVKSVTGRKAIIVISSGVDTFSKATFPQLLQAAQESGVPIYTIGLAPLIQLECAVYGESAPFARIDWNGAQKNLEALAKASSGGRAYVLEAGMGVGAIYDDIMENIRLRYVITYVSSNPSISGPPRNIRVELIDPQTGNPLKLRDTNGKPVSAKVFVQETYSLDGKPAGK